MVDSSGCPTARSGHCVTVAKDEMYMFGGCGLPGNKKDEQQQQHHGGHLERERQGGEEGEEEMLPICLGDLHVYNVARQRWKEVVFPAGTPRPAQRTCAAICSSEEEDRLFLSGGAGDDPYDLRGDLLQYDVRGKRWSVLYDGGAAGGEGSEACPFRRIGHTMVHHSASNRLVLFGGSTGGCQPHQTALCNKLRRYRRGGLPARTAVKTPCKNDRSVSRLCLEGEVGARTTSSLDESLFRRGRGAA